MPNVPICARHRLVLIGIFVLALMSAFIFIPRKNHENPPNKLIVTKFISHTLPMFNNKAFLDFIDKYLHEQIIKTKNSKKKKNKEPQTHKNIYDRSAK